MNLTCPNCSTTFAVDAAKLGPTGKKVRCAKCAHVWHAEVPVTEERKQQVLAEQRQGVRKALQEKIVPDKKPSTAGAAKEPRKLVTYLKIAASLLIILNAGAALTFNKALIGQTGFYDMIGQYDTKSIAIDPNSAIVSQPHQKGTDVVVNWSIKNTSGKAVTSPNVRIKLYDKHAELIGEKLNDSNNKTIAAAGTLKFKDKLIHKTQTGRYLTVEVGNNAELAAR